MKMFLEGFQKLDHAELINVNGGYATIWADTTNNTAVQNNGYSNAGSSSTGYLNVGSVYGYIAIGSVNPYGNVASAVLNEGNNITTAINDSINSHSNEQYIYGKNDCDIWVEKVLKDAGIDISYIWGSAISNDVDQHEKMLEGKTANVPQTGFSVVLMTDHKPTNNFISHTGILELHSDGSCTLYQHSRSSELKEDYPSIQQFQNTYGYNDFDYYYLGK
ncbi:hypothetical protein [Gracilinema caldarium]|uniref:Uncharacterized protein n=1 Tax=Gracilinema caldarium (strain ATCC 51460 / DSM 7334 / H1) TaxID=744872 RepID=F8F245_GRAC1|nr:hypothetical protein [Gracilinema caldarium]AEJ20317.1 hypothetical protein Spica_2197 [Gracilinema caldarium DSM 7334]